MSEEKVKESFRFNLDEGKNPELYWGLRVALPYNMIGWAFGFLVRFGHFPKELGDWGTSILFVFIPVSSQIIDFQGDRYGDYIMTGANLIITLFISWIVFSPIVGLFRGIIGLADKK